MSPSRITIGELAKALGVSRFSVSQLVNGYRNVTAEMALRLAKATSTTPHFWLDLQRSVDLHWAHRSLRRKLKAVRVVRAPISEKELFYTPVAEHRSSKD